MNDLIVQLLNLPNTYIGEAPPEIDKCQWIVLSSGASNTYFGRKTINSPEYAIYARSPSNKEASDCIQSCFKKLQNWNDEHYAISIKRIPRYVGRDDKHRCVYSFRIQFIIGG